MTKNQRLLFLMLVVIGILFILVPQIYIWSESQVFQYTMFKTVSSEQEHHLQQLRLSLLPWRYIGVLQLGTALGLYISNKLSDD